MLNDLEAYAYGIDALESKDFITISAGSEDAEGNRAVISAKTGLGMAGLFWDGFRHHPFACEGGHADFAPQRRHSDRTARVPPEKIRTSELRTHSFRPRASATSTTSSATQKKPKSLRALRQQMNAAADASPLISRLALEGKSPICEQALSIFVSVFGAEAGNCALRYMTTGGIYIGGVIAAKIAPKMQDGTFMHAFLDKGRMESILKDMPVQIIANDDCGLIGAARYTLVQKAFKGSSRAAD